MPAFSRTWTPSAAAARTDSAARVAASPRVADSPCVRSTMPTRWPARTALASVPPHVSSTSSRCAAMASRSTRSSLITECLNGIEFSRAGGGGEAENQADEDRRDRSDRRRQKGHGRVEREQTLQEFSRTQAQQDADDAPQQRERGHFHEKLPHDPSPFRSQR